MLLIGYPFVQYYPIAELLRVYSLDYTLPKKGCGTQKRVDTKA